MSNEVRKPQEVRERFTKIQRYLKNAFKEWSFSLCNEKGISRKRFSNKKEFWLEMARRSLDHFYFFRINFLKQMQSKKFFQKWILDLFFKFLSYCFSTESSYFEEILKFSSPIPIRDRIEKKMGFSGFFFYFKDISNLIHVFY